MSGFVYFIKSPAANAVKIGYSSQSPTKRLKACQTGNADKLIMLGWCAGSVADEQHYHTLFRDFCIRGEWFRLEGSFKEFIGAFLQHYWWPRAAQ